MTCLLSVPLDHGRGRRQRLRPHLGGPPSLLWSHQVRHTGVHVSVYQNIPEQNLPRVPGQEKTQEERQEFIRGQHNARVMAGTDICLFWVFLGLRSAQQPAVILPIISEHRLVWSASRLHLEAAVFWLTESGSRYQSSKQHPAEEMSFSPANRFCFLAICVSVLLTKTPSLGSDW